MPHTHIKKNRSQGIISEFCDGKSMNRVKRDGKNQCVNVISIEVDTVDSTRRKIGPQGTREPTENKLKVCFWKSENLCVKIPKNV